MVKVYNRKPRLAAKAKPPEPPPPVRARVQIQRDRHKWLINGELIDLTKPVSGAWLKFNTPIEAYQPLTITITPLGDIDPDIPCYSLAEIGY